MKVSKEKEFTLHATPQLEYHVALVLNRFDKLVPPIEFDDLHCFGFAPVYASVELLRKDWPDAEFVSVTPCKQQPTERKTQ
jgi:hypothetical protein